jgi:Ca2+-binding RTX toxin-like protein
MIKPSGTVTTLNLTTTLGAEAIDLDSSNILSYGGVGDMFDFGTITKANYTHTGTGALTWDGSSIAGNQGISTNTSSTTADTITGGDGNDTLTGNAGTDKLTGGAGNDTLSGNAGVDTIDGGTGNDVLTGGEGADIITTGTGDDTVTLTESTAAADDVKISNGGNADAATQATTAGGDDTGADTITGFDAGASADSIVLVTATGVTDFNHTTDVVFGTGTAAATSTGIIADYAKNVLIFDMNGDGSANTNNVDMAINMNSLVIDGVAVTTSAHYTTALTNIKADLVYNITGTSAADTIVGGDGSDTVTGGEGADVITLGTGNDNVVFTGASITSATAADTVTGFNASSTAASLDKISFGSTFLGQAFGSGDVSVEASNSIASDNSNDIIIVSNNVAGAGVVSTFIGIMDAWSQSDAQKGVVVVDDGSDAYIYYVDDSLDADATDVTTADVILIGTLSGTDVSGMTAANFTAAI